MSLQSRGDYTKIIFTGTELSTATTPSIQPNDADSMSAFALTFRPRSHYKHVPLVALARVSMKSENVWGLDERGSKRQLNTA
jgi:hypothetical protein